MHSAVDAIIKSLKPERKSPTPDLAPLLTSPQHRKRHELLLGYLPSGQVTLKEFIPFWPRRVHARPAPNPTP